MVALKLLSPRPQSPSPWVAKSGLDARLFSLSWGILATQPCYSLQGIWSDRNYAYRRLQISGAISGGFKLRVFQRLGLMGGRVPPLKPCDACLLEPEKKTIRNALKPALVIPLSQTFCLLWNVTLGHMRHLLCAFMGLLGSRQTKFSRWPATKKHAEINSGFVV